MRSNIQRFFTHDRLDLVIKYRLFQGLASGTFAPGAEAMYARHILARTGGREPGRPDKSNVEQYFAAARALFLSMRARGFDPRHPVPVDQWGRLRDGAHRVACAAVLGLELELTFRTARYPIRQWGIDWFLAQGFSRRYVNGLLDDVNRITGYSNRLPAQVGPGRLRSSSRNCPASLDR